MKGRHVDLTWWLKLVTNVHVTLTTVICYVYSCWHDYFSGCALSTSNFVSPMQCSACLYSTPTNVAYYVYSSPES